MTLLTIWPEAGPETEELRTSDRNQIGTALAEHSIRFSQWPLREGLPEDYGPDQLLEAYGSEIDRVKAQERYQLVDAVLMTPSESPDWLATAAQARQRFLAEHRHDDDEVRFFARGAGVFYLHLEPSVYAVLCEAGDLLGVPAGIRHWFDMGSRPNFAAIRFFHDTNGWVGDFTGDPIASRFPTFDQLMSGHRLG